MRLTRGEALWLDRRREGMGQEAYARGIGVTAERLSAMEHDRRAAPPVAPLVALSTGEYLALARRRRGWTQREVAERYGVSRVTVVKAEGDQTTGAGVLARWWGRRGYPRPRTAAPHRVRTPSV